MRWVVVDEDQRRGRGRGATRVRTRGAYGKHLGPRKRVIRGAVWEEGGKEQGPAELIKFRASGPRYEAGTGWSCRQGLLTS